MQCSIFLTAGFEGVPKWCIVQDIACYAHTLQFWVEELKRLGRVFVDVCACVCVCLRGTHTHTKIDWQIDEWRSPLLCSRTLGNDLLTFFGGSAFNWTKWTMVHLFSYERLEADLCSVCILFCLYILSLYISWRSFNGRILCQSAWNTSVHVLPLPEKTQIGTGREQKLQNAVLSHLLASGILPEILICPKQERWLGSISCVWCRPGFKYYLKSF